jgi:hypothetical protein
MVQRATRRRVQIRPVTASHHPAALWIPSKSYYSLSSYFRYAYNLTQEEKKVNEFFEIKVERKDKIKCKFFVKIYKKEMKCGIMYEYKYKRHQRGDAL